MDFEKTREKDVETRVVEALEKARDLQEKLNAVVTFCDVEEPLDELKSVDEHAPLYGLPIVLKDNVNTKGVRTTASSRILDNYVPVYNAAIVRTPDGKSTRLNSSHSQQSRMPSTA